jgi:predicted N-acetyltransferase YhbS
VTDVTNSITEADIIRPVQSQLEAYNARDIEAFMPSWAEDCQYYAFPDQLLASGTAEIRARHVERFAEPNLHGRLTHRLCMGHVVVDQEIVTRTFPDGPGEVDVLAIYEVAGGSICKAWFRMGPRRLDFGGGFSMRTANAADADLARAVTRAAYAKWVPVIGREPRPMTADYAAAVVRHRIDLVYQNGAAVGLIEMIPEADHLYIQNVAVLPELHGQGLGRKLLAHAERVARALGHDDVRLLTNQAMTANIQLYQKLGYVIEREEATLGWFTVHMRKRLGDGT